MTLCHGLNASMVWKHSQKFPLKRAESFPK